MAEPVIYDHAEYHFGAPSFLLKNLPVQNSGTHIGMFFAWMVLHRLDSFSLRQQAAEPVEQVRSRQITGRDLLFNHCAEALNSDALNEEGNAFAHWYYEDLYLRDYEEVLVARAGSTYEVADTWANYDRLAPIIDQRFNEFSGQYRKPSGKLGRDGQKV